MSTTSPALLALTEYSRTRFPADALSPELAERLWRDYGEKIAITYPSPKNNWQWELSSLGWVGLIPLAPELHILLHPKVRLRNLFGMLEYAYRLKGFRVLDGLFDCGTIEEFFSELAAILARRTLDRARKGLYRAYIAENASLPYLRGSLDVQKLMREPYSASIHCDYHESTPDIDDNRILLWTLSLVARSGACNERALPPVRRAVQLLQGAVSYIPASVADCTGRRYNHLNDDYRALHALCRFFLEHAGPSLEQGDRRMIPFLVDMARLFELFVAEWLRSHLPSTIRLGAQETITFGSTRNFHFQIDLVLSDALSGRPLFVIDTKYKTPSSPDADDIAQAIAYAEAKGCTEAILLYPVSPATHLDATIGDIRIRSMAFQLDDDLEASGHALLHELLEGNQA